METTLTIFDKNSFVLLAQKKKSFSLHPLFPKLQATVSIFFPQKILDEHIMTDQSYKQIPHYVSSHVFFSF